MLVPTNDVIDHCHPSLSLRHKYTLSSNDFSWSMHTSHTHTCLLADTAQSKFVPTDTMQTHRASLIYSSYFTGISISLNNLWIKRRLVTTLISMEMWNGYIHDDYMKDRHGKTGITHMRLAISDYKLTQVSTCHKQGFTLDSWYCTPVPNTVFKPARSVVTQSDILPRIIIDRGTLFQINHWILLLLFTHQRAGWGKLFHIIPRHQTDFPVDISTSPPVGIVDWSV